ncbi:ubiquitin carboxyl-terminal hydrolase 50-like [Labrus bergylta]|uniref:ubiquitin carboxyl-terminal hydrolase 50-like n=1 Tax=Labrus bergylta TaxID=56723 RepID=UPI003314190D
MTTEIHNSLDQNSDTDKELRNLFEKLETETCRTVDITNSFDITDVHQQRDAAECLEMILHKVSPQASQVFKGQLKYSTTCSKGHNLNTETNPFLTLPLSLKDANNSTFSVESGFDNVFQTKSFIGDNLVYCEQCGKKTEATRECEMLEFPRILVLLLKRFDFDNNTMSHFKSDRMVVMPHTLQRQNKMYTLCGIVNHMGSLKGGHYTATILSKEDNTWCEFNDSHVRKLEEQPFANSQTYNSSTAYLLVYRDSEGFRDKVEHRQDEQSGDQRERNRKVKVSSLIQEDPLLPEKPRQDREAEEGTQQSKRQEECTSLTNILKKPPCIALIVCGGLLIVILAIILSTLNLS